MKNRKLLLVLSLLLALTVSLTGTLAYLTDTDSDVNVMTLGNVKIEQLENGQSESGFIQNQPLYPAYYGDNWKADDVTGAIEKRVNVRNTGKSDAYVRTVFAFEAGELTKAEFDQYIHLLWNGVEADVQWETDKITINNEKYFLAWYTYPIAIAPNAEAGETLQRVVMDKAADSSVVSKLGDSNYNILVVTQAVQTNNFDTLYTEKGAAGVLDEAFGALSESSHPWMDMNGVTDENGDQAPDDAILVYNEDELIQAINNGFAHIVLADDIKITDASKFMYQDDNGAPLYLYHKDVTLHLNEHKITVAEDALLNGKTNANGALLVRYSTLNIVGEGSIETLNQSICVYGWAHSDINIYGGTYESNASLRNESAIYVNNPNVMIHVYGGDFTKCDYAFNVHDTKCGTTAVITLHEGIEFKQFLKNGTTDVFMSDLNAGRIVVAEGCKLQTNVIDGVTWYKVVSAVPDGWIGAKNVDEMREAMKIPGAKIILLDDIMIKDDKGSGYCLYAKYDCTIDLNGNAIEVNIPGKELYATIYALNGAKVDIIGDGDMKINGGVSNFIWSTGANGATEVSIYGGNWVQDSEDFTTENNMYVEGFYGTKGGVINIYGGTFNWKGFEKYTINEKNNGVVNVYGGTFINFDPRVSHDSDGSYVADGYKVVSETQSNGDVWYSVVPE